MKKGKSTINRYFEDLGYYSPKKLTEDQITSFQKAFPIVFASPTLRIRWSIRVPLKNPLFEKFDDEGCIYGCHCGCSCGRDSSWMKKHRPGIKPSPCLCHSIDPLHSNCKCPWNSPDSSENLSIFQSQDWTNE